MATRRHDEQQLLHWLNSLPLASCLLVDSFVALQNGDVLYEVANTIQTICTKEPPPKKCTSTAQAAHKIQQVLTFVLPHVLRNARGYHLRDPESILDILDGNIPAICSVLSILKTLWSQKESRLQQKKYLNDQVKKLHLPAQVQSAPSNPVKQSTITYTPPQRLVPKAFHPPEIPWNTSTLLKGSKTKSKPEDTCESKAKTPQQLRKRFRVQYMVDPLWEVKPATQEHIQPPPPPPSLELNNAYEVCRWIRSLGIALPFDQISDTFAGDLFLQQAGQAFRDGVILCQVAAILAYRTGEPFVKSKLRSLAGQPSCFIPQGCCVSPQTAAQRRHNIQLALSFLTKPIPSTFTNIDDPNSPHFTIEIWHFLHYLRKSSTKLLQTKQKAQTSPPKKMSTNSDVERLPCITHEQAKRVQEWLSSLQIALPTQVDGLLQDPVRNGSLLCQLLNRLANLTRPIKVHNTPTTLHQAKENVFQALSALRSLHLHSIPTIYLTSSEPILKGHFQVVWGLLYHIMDALQCIDMPLKPDMTQNPAASEDLKVLLVNWLQTEGYLDKLKCLQVHPKFEDIKKYIQSGVLLLLIASRLTQVSILTDPTDKTTRQMAMKNILQALELLRSVPNIPQRYLWCEEKIYSGHETVMVGLLEDIRQVHNNLPQASNKIQVIDTDDNTEDIRTETPVSNCDSEEEQEEEEVNGLLSCWHINTEVGRAQQWRETDIDPSDDLFPLPHNENYSPKTSSTKSVDFYQDDVIPQAKEFHLDTTIDELQLWLKSLHIHASLEGSHLPEFQNGLILVELIEKVAHLRRLDGVCRNPQGKRANCLHNIKKVMDILRLNKSIPLSILRRERDILSGNSNVILYLLDQTRRAYGHHRPKHP